MKGLTTVITIVLGMMLFQCNSMAEEKKTVDVSTQLANAQAALKQIKTELELAKTKLQLKDKQMELLTQKFVALHKKLASNSRKRSTSRSKSTRTAQSHAASQAAAKKLQKQQQRKQHARKIKYYESEKTEIYKRIRAAEKELKYARGIIKKANRQSRVSQCKSTLRKLYSKKDSLNSTIKKLKYKIY
ncbi:MAG: hypothetical protein KAS17_04150 [Victivallaceae bacterium]|nr:hypothetical protein [Victivallaceae bacterium]